MALSDPYATLAELKKYAGGITHTNDDAALTDALESASRGIELVCRRVFNKVDAPTARVYYPEHDCLVEPHDFHTTAGLIVRTDTTGDGVFDTTWDESNYELRPLNGIVSGQTGWPYNEIWADGSRLFPARARRASVEVTASWGWAAVPKPVKTACLIVAEEIFKLKDAPFGVAGFGEYGQLRVRENPIAMKKLLPYVRNPILVS